MDKLKSRSGCLTCVARRKKCDEATPRCGHCTRLDISCVSRQRATERALVLISATNLKAGTSPPLRSPITNGFPPFRSDFERQLSIESPAALAALVSCMAGPGFRDVVLFGTFCAQSRLVRQALVAFSAYTQGRRCGDSYKLSLRSYQFCVADMKQNRSYEGRDPAERDRVLTAIMFLGLLEGLKIGDSSNAVAHFEMCRKLLTARLSAAPALLNDAALLKLYRVVAECIMYNLAALSPFHVGVADVATDWGSSFDCLFPGGDHALSPFLGGFHDIYRLMLRINIHLRQIPSTTTSAHSAVQSSQTLDALWWELHALEVAVPPSYRRVEGADGTRLYKAKHRISVLALRIHLVKISIPAIAAADVLIHPHLQTAIEILRQQDIREPGNPALRWPLTILACAAHVEDDYSFIVERMKELEVILDPSNCGKLRSAYTLLQHYRQGALALPLRTRRGSWTPHDQLDFLLEPQFLDQSGSGPVEPGDALTTGQLAVEQGDALTTGQLTVEPGVALMTGPFAIEPGDSLITDRWAQARCSNIRSRPGSSSVSATTSMGEKGTSHARV